MLRHQTIEQGIESLQALSTNAKRVQAVRNEIAANSLLSVDQTHDDLMKQVLSYAEKRNKIAHGLWGAHPAHTDLIYRLPVKRSEEHTSVLQSLMRISYAVFCLKNKTPH